MLIHDSLAENIHMECSKEAATKTLTQCGTVLRLHCHGSVCEAESVECSIEIFIFITILRVNTRVNDWLGFLVPRKGFDVFFLDLRIVEGVADIGLSYGLHAAHEVADLTLWEVVCLLHIWLNYTDLVDIILDTSMVTCQLSLFPKVFEIKWLLTHDLDEAGHSTALLIMSIEKECFKRSIRRLIILLLNLGSRYSLNDCVEDLVNILAGFRRYEYDLILVESEFIRELLHSSIDVSSLGLNFVDDWNDLKSGIEGLIEV